MLSDPQNKIKVQMAIDYNSRKTPRRITRADARKLGGFENVSDEDLDKLIDLLYMQAHMAPHAALEPIVPAGEFHEATTGRIAIHFIDIH